MRFAAIADIHGNRSALEAVLEDIAHLGIDRIVNLGDCLSGPLDPGGTAAILRSLDLPTVAGNHDRWLIDRAPEDMGLWERWSFPQLGEDDLGWLRSIPPVLHWDAGPGAPVFLCHGTPASDEIFWLERPGDAGRMRMATEDEVRADLGGVTAPLVLCGHTHIPRVVRIDGRMIANPGAVGCPAYRDDRQDPPRADETGARDARYGVFERIGDRWVARLMTVSYDAGEMIERARAHGAEDWALALDRGWVTGRS